MEIEVWRPVRGYEGYYEVSDQGRVKRIAGGSGARLGKLRILAPGKNGYLFISLKKDTIEKRFCVHRLVLQAFKRPMRAAQTVTRHLNGIRTDNRLENLAWGSPSENQFDRFIHGTDSRGEKCCNAKLTEPQVYEISSLWKTGELTQLQIAEQFSVTLANISHIVNRKNWKHLNPGEPLPCTKLSSRC